MSAVATPRTWQVPAALKFALLPALLVAAIALGTAVGPTSIPPLDTVRIVLWEIGLRAGQPVWTPEQAAIVWSIRLPEVVAAGLVGAALAVAGALLQAVFRNPLADPYVVGTAAGAQLGVVIALLVPGLAIAGFGSAQALAFVFALATVLFVYAVARSGGRAQTVTLLLAGFVVSSFLISGTSLFVALLGRMDRLIAWTMGGVSVVSWAGLAVLGPVVLLATAAAYPFARSLDVLLLGEDGAETLGVRVERLKFGAVVLAALLTALAVSMAGIIAFVGLIVPHAVRLVYGPGHRVLLPAAALGGASFLILADLLARTAVPSTELPLGVVTAIVGAPLFLHLLLRGKRVYGL